MTLLLGDCKEILQDINDNSVDLIVTDPPYGISFMGKDWDKALPDPEIWKECFRVLKEGKLAFVMCSPRQDVLARMIISLEDAGFRTGYTSIYWTYASGFPKAANVSKLIDKRNGRYPNKDFRDYLNTKRHEKNISIKDINLCLGLSTKGGNVAFDMLSTKDENRYLLPTIEQYKKLKTLLDLDNRFDELIERTEAERNKISSTGNLHKNDRTHGWSMMKKKEEYLMSDNISITQEAKKMEGAYVGFQPKPAVEIILVVSKGKTLTWLDQAKIPASEPESAFASLIQVCDSVLNSDDTTTWYNKNRKDHDPHASDNDDILGKELHQFLVYAQNRLHLSNALPHENSLYATQDSQFCCPFCRHFYDALTRWVEVYDQDESPSLADVLSHIRQFALEHKHIPQNQYNVHLSNVDAVLRILGLLVSGDSLAYCTNPRYNTKRFPANLLVSDNVLDDYSRYFSLDAWAKDRFPFIITPKASKSERNEGIDNGDSNRHPTVKPIKLMSYLITLGSREGDRVLDPFMGSGSTLIAAYQTFRRFLGIEIDKQYLEIAAEHVGHFLEQRKLDRYFLMEQNVI